MGMGKSEGRPKWTYKLGDGEILDIIHKERDVGVIMQGSGHPVS